MTSSPLVLRGLRGATTCTENSTEAIQAAVTALMDALVDRNGLTPDQLVSVTFSVTADLDADDIRPVTLGKQRRKLSGLLPGSQLLHQLQQRLSIELMGSGQVLWLYRP